MGSKLDRRAVSSPEKKLTALFEEVCPFFMSIGMSYKEFWEGDVSLPKFYLRAYRLKQEREFDQQNFNAWLQGRYIHDAFAVVLSNAFSDKHSNSSHYHEKPMELRPREKTEEELRIEQEKEELRVQQALSNFVLALGGSNK